MHKPADSTPRARDEATEKIDTKAGGEDDVRRIVLHVAGSGLLHTFPLPPDRELVIGRSSEADVRIDVAGISRRHARLRTGPPVSIEDLGSANGTKIGSHRLGPGEIANVDLGAPIALGSVRMFTMLATAEPDVPVEPFGARPAQDPGVTIVQSPAMVEIYQRVDRVAASPLSVLLLGETGVGKEVMAEQIHRRSPRAGKPFLGLNCAALSESLLESELFGHEKGAFTGAAQAKPGLLEAAQGGTVFLDEVGEMPPTIQVKLLRVVEERRVTRVGGLRARDIDVRFIAATNRNLEVEIERGSFRRDLYFRLNGIALTIPPLRERQEEIEGLALLFLERISRRLGLASTRRLSAGALEILRAHSWSGNVRELRNTVERAAVLCPGDTIEPQHLLLDRPSSPTAASPAAPVAQRPAEEATPTPDSTSVGHLTPSTLPSPPTMPADLSPPPEPAAELRRGDAPAAGELPPLRGDLEALERRRIIAALEQCGGNQTKAARLLGIARNTLLARIAQYGLPRPRSPR